MAVLVYIESDNNQFKKSSYEALCYGKALGDNIGEAVYGVVVNCTDTESLNAYGADKIININSCLLYTSPSPRDKCRSRMPSSA